MKLLFGLSVSEQQEMVESWAKKKGHILSKKKKKEFLFFILFSFFYYSFIF